MDYRSPLSRARGLGSAHSGTEHFIAQRLSSWVLIPLTIWFVVAIAYLASSDYAQVMQWFQDPLNGILFISFLLLMSWHAVLGLQVVIEDYLRCEMLKFSLLILMKSLLGLLTIAGLYFIMRITLGVSWHLTGTLLTTGMA